MELVIIGPIRRYVGGNKTNMLMAGNHIDGAKPM
jgi:hypothetical protein